GHAFAQYSDLLVLPGYEPREVVGRMVQCAVTAAACDSLNFLKVRADSMLARGMPANRVEMGKAQGAPYVALDGFADFDAYFHTITAETGKNRRNARTGRGREGAVSHDIAATGDEALGVIARTLSGRAGRLREQGLSSRAFREEDFARFCATLPA